MQKGQGDQPQTPLGAQPDPTHGPGLLHNCPGCQERGWRALPAPGRAWVPTSQPAWMRKEGEQQPPAAPGSQALRTRHHHVRPPTPRSAFPDGKELRAEESQLGCLALGPGP